MMRFFFLLFFASSCLGFSSPVNATATLSRNRVAAGEMAQLDIKVTGTQQADVPSEIAAEGLQIKLTGQSSEVQMINFKVSSSVIYSYIVMPLKTGSLTIPPVTVRAEGQILKTTALPLAVMDAGMTTSNGTTQPPSSANANTAPARSPNRVSANSDRDQYGFAEIIIPKKKFYVGEVIPVEIRFYVDARYSFSTTSPLNFSSEGILTDRFQDPEQGREERNNLIYNVATFRTLFAAVKPGALDLPAATVDIAVAVPAPTPPGIDPDLFARMMGGRSPFVRERKMTLKTKSLHCEVMPLPAEGRPMDFSGAIGEFQLDGLVAPKKVAQGDPVVLSLKLLGKGNFQALKGPQLTNQQGWRTYPPTEHFEAADIFKWKGVKTFETTMIAQQPVTATPGSSFSYFDPVAVKYVTLTTKPFPIEIIGSAPAAAPIPTATPATPAAVKPVLIASPKEPTEHSWQDPLHQKKWVMTWLACFCAVVGLLILFLMKAYLQRERSPLDKTKAHWNLLMKKLEQGELSAMEFYDTAAAAAELLSKPEMIEQEGLVEIFKRHDEMQYGGRNAVVTSLEKERILGILKKVSAEIFKNR